MAFSITFYKHVAPAGAKFDASLFFHNTKRGGPPTFLNNILSAETVADKGLCNKINQF